jgi:uncharacterized membrane protein
MSDIALLKTIHVLSAAVLLGTGFGIAFFCWLGYRLALRRNEIAIVRATLRLTVAADAIFTAPAVVVQAATGAWLVHLYGWSMASPWALSAWGLFFFAGACWLPVVWLQIVLKRQSEQSGSMAALPARFHRLFTLWFVLGIPAFAAVVAIFYLMVAKPLGVA